MNATRLDTSIRNSPGKPVARYAVVDGRLENQQLPSRVFADSNEVEALLRQLPRLRVVHANERLIVIDTWLDYSGRRRTRRL